MTKLVSIIIPAFNAEQWLAGTLASALAQTWGAKEIIVVDDGSTDNTLSVARRFASARVQVISQQSRGASAARNRALRVAQGDYIQYLDADDLMAPDKIERQVELLGDSADVTATGAWALFFHDPAEAEFVHQALWADAEPVDWLVTKWSANLMMITPAWLVPRGVSERAGWWDETILLNNDGEYFSRVVLASRMIKFCAAAKTYYRSGLADSLSRQRSPGALKSGYRAIELSSERLLARENTTRTRRACATRYQRFAYNVYPDAPELCALAESKVAELGGTDLVVGGGPAFRWAARFLGWRRARRLQRFMYRCGYKNYAARLQERRAGARR